MVVRMRYMRMHAGYARTLGYLCALHACMKLHMHDSIYMHDSISMHAACEVQRMISLAPETIQLVACLRCG